MGRIRTVKPEFFRDEKLQDLEVAHPNLKPMLVFEGLWGQSDKAGNFPWNPRMLHLDILPFIEFDFSASLVLLREAGLLSQYAGDDGKQYGTVLNFSKHQRISGKEAQEPAKFPNASPGSTGEATETAGREREREREEEGNIDGQVHEIASLHPKIKDAFHLPHDVALVIAEAIARDGRDFVWAGTKTLSDAVQRWPPGELQFVPSAQKFFRESQYRNIPEFWERSSNGNGKPSRAEQALNQQITNRNAARRAVGLDH